MQSENQLARRARRQIISKGLVEVDDDARGRRRLAIRADAHALDPIFADRDAALPGGHHGLRKVHHDARWRVQSAELGRHFAVGAHLDPDVVRAPDYVDSIELAWRLSGRGHSQHQQRYELCQLLLSHFASPQPADLWPARNSLKLDFKTFC